MPFKKKALFVVIEGMEAVGKSTAAKYLKEYLTELSWLETILTREPGGTPLAEEIRIIFKSPFTKSASSLTQSFLIAAARNDHLENLIIPTLEVDKNVICDRFILSTLVYQEHYDFLVDLNSKLVPDLTIVLTAELETIVNRMTNRSKDWRDLMVNEWHTDKQNRMLEIVKNDTDYKISKNYLVVPTDSYNTVDALHIAISTTWNLDTYYKGLNHTTIYK